MGRVYDNKPLAFASPLSFILSFAFGCLLGGHSSFLRSNSLHIQYSTQQATQQTAEEAPQAKQSKSVLAWLMLTLSPPPPPLSSFFLRLVGLFCFSWVRERSIYSPPERPLFLCLLCIPSKVLAASVFPPFLPIVEAEGAQRTNERKNE